MCCSIFTPLRYELLKTLIVPPSVSPVYNVEFILEKKGKKKLEVAKNNVSEAYNSWHQYNHFLVPLCKSVFSPFYFHLLQKVITFQRHLQGEAMRMSDHF